MSSIKLFQHKGVDILVKEIFNRDLQIGDIVLFDKYVREFTTNFDYYCNQIRSIDCDSLESWYTEEYDRLCKSVKRES